jgi:hypothetical protein
VPGADRSAAEQQPCRRGFVGALAGSAAVVGGLTTTQRARAAYDQQPEHVTLEFDNALSELRNYRPALDLSALDIRPDTDTPIYAWKHSSPEWDNGDTVFYSYWVWYSAGQEGVSEEDSHVPDREPVIVERDVPSGDIRAVHYDEYHYLVGSTVPVLDESNGGQHPVLRVVNPWHNYSPAETAEGTELLSLTSMDATYEDWLKNGWEAHRRSVLVPPVALARGNWWATSMFGLNRNASIARTAQSIKNITGVDPLGRFFST